jgi:hypothetical protein
MGTAMRGRIPVLALLLVLATGAVAAAAPAGPPPRHAILVAPTSGSGEAGLFLAQELAALLRRHLSGLAPAPAAIDTPVLVLEPAAETGGAAAPETLRETYAALAVLALRVDMVPARTQRPARRAAATLAAQMVLAPASALPSRVEVNQLVALEGVPALVELSRLVAPRLGRLAVLAVAGQGLAPGEGDPERLRLLQQMLAQEARASRDDDPDRAALAAMRAAIDAALRPAATP